MPKKPTCVLPSSSVLSKFVGPVGQSDIFYECPAKNVRVESDQMSDRKYKNIHLVDKRSETQVTIKDNNYV